MSEERLGVSIRSFQMPSHYNGSSLPQSVDWKKKGVVTKVKKQVHVIFASLYIYTVLCLPYTMSLCLVSQIKLLHSYRTIETISVYRQ